MDKDPDSSSAPGGLQFDKVLGTGAGMAMVCSYGETRIEWSYYEVAAGYLCESCKALVDTQTAARFARGHGAAGMMRAALFGLAAALRGASLHADRVEGDEEIPRREGGGDE